MDICERGLKLLYDFEGKHKAIGGGRYKAYLDRIAVPNIPTIYAGLTRGVTMDMIVTEEEGERMLRKELAVTEDAVERLVRVHLNQHQFSALTVLVYNIGVGAFAGSTLLKLLNEGKYETVPGQMARWCHAGGKKINGLVRRRAAEGALFLEPMPEEADLSSEAVESGEEAPRMPQRVEEARPPVSEAIKESVTLRGAFLAFLGTIASGINQAYEWTTSVIQGAGPEIVDLKTTISPLDPLIKLTPTVLYVVIIVGLVIVVVRKIGDHTSGKAV